MKTTKLVSLALFFILLALPAVQFAFNPFPISPLSDTKAKLPAGNPLARIWDGGDYTKRIENWFNGIFPMRDLYVRTANQFNYSVFGESRQVLFGNDGWLFDRVAAENNQLGVDNEPRERMEQTVANIVRLNDYLNKRGIKLLLVPVPFKNTLYGDKLQFDGLRRPAITGFQRFLEALKERPELAMIDVSAAVSRVSDFDILPYYKTDLHWTYASAFFVGEQVVNYVSESERIGSPFRQAQEFKKSGFFLGTEGAALGIFSPPHEDAILPVLPGNRCAQKFAVKDQGGDDQEEYRSDPAKCSTALLPKIMIVGNSYMNFFDYVGTYDYFDSVRKVIDYRYMMTLDQRIPDGTKYLVMQFYETEIFYLMSSPEWWAWLDKYESAPFPTN